MALKLGTPVPVADLMKSPGRKLSDRDVALGEFVLEAAKAENKALALPWDYAPEKPLTARAALVRAVKRNGLEGKVHVSARDGLLYVSQVKLSNRGRAKK